MDDTRHPILVRRPPRPRWALLALPPLLALALWPGVFPGLPRVPRLLLAAGLFAALWTWSRARRSRTRGRAGSRGGRVPRGPRVRRSPFAVPPRGDRVRAAIRTRGAVTIRPVEELAAEPGWLHLVSASSGEPLERALIEIGIGFSGPGMRVALVDGARRLRAHDRFRVAERPGLLECLAGEAWASDCVRPVREGLWLLPRGGPLRAEAWPQLGRVLDELRPRFDRVVMALDFATPREAGPPLAERGAVGWWCHENGASGLPGALSERLGIPLRNLGLSPPDEVLLEGAEARPPAPAETPPTLVDCDLQVRERLRFLLWMHRVRDESRREVESPLARV